MKRTLTFVEYRDDLCSATLESIKESTTRLGWDLKVIGKVDWLSVDDNTFLSQFSKYVMWRAIDAPLYQYSYRMRLALERSGAICVNMNPAGSMAATSDKYFQHGTLASDSVLDTHRLPIFLINSADEIKQLVKLKRISYPFVIKPNMGTLGDGIVLIQTEEELDNYQGDFNDVSVQRYVDTDHSWRVFVMGGVAMGAMKKFGDENNPGDFKAKCSGLTRVTEENEDLKEQLCYLAARATVAAGLEYSGIDLIEDEKTGDIFVIENNIVASWIGGFRDVVGVNMADEVVYWFEDMASRSECPKYDCMYKYVTRRKKYLSRKSQKMFDEILDWKEKPVKKKWYDRTISGKIKQAYFDILNDDYDEKEVRDLIQEVEDRTEMSRYGNYIGGETLEDAIETTARYIAVCGRMI